MALTKIMGQNFRAFVGSVAAAGAIVEETNCTVQLTGNLEDSSTKDTESSYSKETMVSRQWQVTVDSLQATAARLKAIITQFNSDSAVTVGWDQTDTTAGTNNRTPSNASFSRSGYAHLTDVNISAPNRANITIALQYQGTGGFA